MGTHFLAKQIRSIVHRVERKIMKKGRKVADHLTGLIIICFFLKIPLSYQSWVEAFGLLFI